MSGSSTLHILVVDDELLARQRLVDLLDGREEVGHVETASSGEAAVDLLAARHLDLVFLDIQMTDLSGLDVVREIGPGRMPVTIFVTAYDEYALSAFELATLDYLLKPFDDERFEQAFARAVELIHLRSINAMKEQFAALLQEDGEHSPTDDASPPSHLERIAVESRGQVTIVPVAEIDHVRASGTYIELHTADEKHLIRKRMKTIDEQLDPAHFFRIHRSSIVRLDAIEALLHRAGGRYAVRLKDGTRLPLSRSRREALEEQLGLMR